MPRQVRVRGRGRVQLPAYGIADAERVVEKELAGLWPGSTVVVEEVARIGPARIVEEFRVGYRISGSVAVEAGTDREALQTAYRQLRGRFRGSRYERTVWEKE